MGQYIVGRLLQVVLVFLAITLIVFLMLHLAPGDPLDTILGTKAGRISAEVQAEMRHNLGLDRSLPVQYVNWLWKALHGDLGRSYVLRQEVFPLVVERLQATMLLAAGAMLVAAPLGVLGGVAAAVRHNSVGDRLVSTVATLGICTPAFFLGMVLILLFSLRLGLLPSSGMHAVGRSDLPDLLSHMLMPMVCLGAPSAAVIARMTRSSMLDVLFQDYVTAARAKGLTRGRVIWQHAFRNCLIAVITVLGLELGFLLGGAVLVEVVFSWPGIGLLMWDAVLRRDFPVVQGAVLAVAASYVLINLAVDLLYHVIDPRIRLAG